MNIIIVILVLCVLFFYSNYKEKKEREAKEQKEQMQKEKAEKRKNDIEIVKQFAEKNNHSINKLMEKRENLYASAVRNYISGKLSSPLIPTKVTPVYKGNAMAEYASQKINNERQETYNNLLSYSNTQISKGLKYKTQYKNVEKEIIEELKVIPESQEYVKILQNIFEEDEKIFCK